MRSGSVHRDLYKGTTRVLYGYFPMRRSRCLTILGTELPMSFGINQGIYTSTSGSKHILYVYMDLAGLQTCKLQAIMAPNEKL